MRTAVRRTVYVSWRKELVVSETLIPMTAVIGVTRVVEWEHEAPLDTVRYTQPRILKSYGTLNT